MDSQSLSLTSLQTTTNGLLNRDTHKSSLMNSENTSMFATGEKKLSLNDYQEKAWSYALPSAKDISYLFLGLTGEVGELCSAQAKWIRDNPTTTDSELWEKKQEMLKKELGDILWFVAGIARNYYWNLEDIAQMNLNKLEDRKNRNVIQGSGDNR